MKCKRCKKGEALTFAGLCEICAEAEDNEDIWDEIGGVFPKISLKRKIKLYHELKL